MGLFDLLPLSGPIGTGVKSFVGQQRPFFQDLGYGLMKGKNWQEGMEESAKRSETMAPLRSREAERMGEIQQQQEQRNQTMEWLQQNYPQFAGLPPAEGFQAAMKMLGQQAGGGDENWYGNLVPIQNEDGSITYAQVSNRGGFKPLDVPEGVRPLSPVQQLDVGTGFTGVDKFGNPTGQTVPIDNRTPARDKAIGTGEGEFAIKAKQAAADAQQSLASTVEARKLLDSGMITGFGADAMVGFGKALQQVGINLAPDAIANTEAFVATRAQEVGRLIQLFGAGTGLSDADREFATKAAAGQITMTEQSIRRILDINERAARNVITRSQQQMGEVGAAPPQGQAAPAAPAAPGGQTSTGVPWSIE